MGIFSNSDPERERYEQLRSIVKLGIAQFQKTGRALREIRDSELYKFDCQTFEECCRMHWGISSRHAGRLIEAASFCDEIGPAGPHPATERQVREISTLPKEERADAWREAAAAGGTPRAIAAAVAKRRPRHHKTKGLKPLRLRVPGGSIVITPNRKATDYEPLLHAAIQMITQRRAAA